jgi:hypothetical protein
MYTNWILLETVEKCVEPLIITISLINAKEKRIRIHQNKKKNHDV